MPSKFGGIEVTPTTPSGGSRFGGIPVESQSAPNTPAQPSGFWGNFAHELWQQGGQPLLEGLQNHPIATLAHLLGSAAGISTGTTPVPGPGGQIEVGGPTQAAATADIAERGPAAIAAATTLSALPIVLGTAGKAAGTSRLATAGGASLRAGVNAIPNALETSALRYTGVPQIVRPMIKAFKESMAGSKAPATATIPWSQIIAKAAEKEPAPLPESVTQELTRPSEPAPTPAPPQTPAVAPTVPQAAPTAPAAPVPPKTQPQATGGPPAAKETAIARARATRAASADSLSQAFNDVGVTSDSLRKLRVWDWPKAAQQVGVDFPVTHTARLKLIRDTLGALEQKESAAPTSAPSIPVPPTPFQMPTPIAPEPVPSPIGTTLTFPKSTRTPAKATAPSTPPQAAAAPTSPSGFQYKGFLATLGDADRENLFSVMREYGNKAQSFAEQHGKLRPNYGEVAAGGAHMDPLMKQYAIEAVSREIGRGASIEDAIAAGKQEARLTAENFNKRLGKSPMAYQIQRPTGMADSLLDEYGRRLRKAIGK